ncbi:MAG: amino acid ABC transporter substrate-binding protein [Methanobrevibacter sp.]|uniref:Amino acid ABC transporter substrate-binding protein n=1 Tax=Methanobrevibacter millerae TaxID=230361 RepID=A0A8T3VE84_9EURY|nr:amino acid ABC transporter substrate-binding protein [Methanobrevibacter millerae]MBE6505492.1 amino acid ABC transporter substrate-binding protein [Methanobrevibacter millerae]MBR0058079.1 amino acid ABC transporter substrate-binding protein [Methanobrevibacter sp.]MBR0370051.1 amino acid ABC transporter substrate-binding protein [Methanobrevibacter sp.]
MNKKIGFILALVLIAFLVMGTASAGLFDFLGGGNSTAKVTNNDSNLIVGFDAEFPPYGFSDGKGGYQGFDLDLAQEVCNRNNWTLVKQPIDWDAKDAELNSGTIDCIWNGFTINGRENDYTWSEPYIDNKQVIVVKADSGINSLADLKGKNVETQKDSSALAALQGDNKTIGDTFGKLVEVADYNTAFMDLKSGACDAVALDIGVAQYQVNGGNDTGSFKILNDTISSEKYGIGFKKGNTDLKDQVQKTLDEMFADGTVAKIAENYTTYGVPGSLIQK